METQSPVLNEAQLTRLGEELYKQFGTYEKDRRTLEQQWLKNYRQRRGVYDPEVRSEIEPGRSTAYPKYTRQKSNGTVARLMEMLFPRTEKNWGLEASKVPNLSTEDTQATINKLQEEKQQAAGQDGQAAKITNEEIEKRLREVANAKALKMGTVIEDQLGEMDYVQINRQVLASGVDYGIGVLEGPFVKREKKRSWARNSITGLWEAQERAVLRPYFEPLMLWEWYPDLSAKTWDQQDGYFKRRVVSRANLADLAKRSDYFGDRIKKYLKDHESGNFKERDWEQELRTDGVRDNPSNLAGRKYETVVWNGFVSGRDLRAAGVDIAEDALDDQHEAVVEILDRVVIKARLNPYERKKRMIHPFVYENEESGFTGQGLPQIVRDSQMGMCEATRMMFDNGSIVCGPNVLLRMGLLAQGQDPTIRAFKAWFTDPDNDTDPANTARPVEDISFNSHIPELREILRWCTEMMDAEAALPPPALGDVSQGGSEALRTRGNASMFLGAAALPIRDAVRNFDRFTTSVITSLYDWNMEFNEDAGIKGDYVAIARGSTSLIAKEVRAQALDYLAQTLTPEERIHIKPRKFLEERMRVRDLDFEDILEDEDVVKQLQEAMQRKEDETRAKQAELIAAQVKEVLTSALKNVALAKKADVSADVGVYSAIQEGLKGAADIDAKNRGSSNKAGALPA